MLGEERGVLCIHARQGRVTPYLGEDDTHDEGYVAGAGQHPAQGERVPSPAIGGQADEVIQCDSYGATASPLASRECLARYRK